MENYLRVVDERWSFRKANTKEFTHCYHSYPAMMIPQVARCLMQEFAPKGKFNLLFDPYVGSGTSLVEASLIGVNSVGTDLNPLARLISKVKTSHYNEEEINKIFHNIDNDLDSYNLNKVLNKDFGRISNYRFWYSEDSLCRLSYISQLIDLHASSNTSDFFNVLLSEVVREVSFTRNGEFKRFKMSQKSLEKFNPDVFNLFREKFIRNYNGLIDFNLKTTRSTVLVSDFNTTNFIPNEILEKESVDMVVTSPPYGDSRTTVAYGQFSRWANEWFGFAEAKSLDNKLMGGSKAKEQEFITTSITNELNQIKELDEKRYMEVVSFLNDYYKSIENVASVVRPGGTVCYVVGNRNVKGIQIPLDYFTAETFERYGFKHKVTIVREIPNKRMPLKTSPTNISGIKVPTMSNEYIVILEKKV